jgi:hypothetical protein
VHEVGLGEGEGFADKASKTLTKRSVPALDVRRLADLFADWLALLIRNNCLIDAPEVTEAGAAAIHQRDGIPEPATALFTSVAEHEGNDLTRVAAECDPDPVRLTQLHGHPSVR